MSTMKPGGGPPQSTLPPPQFFVDHKKGEVNELKQLLRSIYIDKDPAKKKDVIKKVIAYMTLGIDVSRLYPEMVKASQTSDIVTKKMVYLYLINYAQQNSELAILAINTFQMDLKTQNHKIRGLALRSLCSLKFEGVHEYMQNALAESLNDVDPYVKKTAIIGCVKFFHLNKSAFKKTDFADKIYALTRDKDPLVVINAIEAMNEILADKGGIDIDRQLIIPLLNRIKDFNEWGQSIILDITSKYNPTDQQEKFDIMNLLEDRFKHASSSVVLGTVKVFLHLTKDDQKLYKQVVQRLQAPLITLMTSSETTESFEISFMVLSHIKLLVLRGGNIYFENEYKQFFVKYDEPSYIKNIKLEILGHIASENNIQEVVNELCEYVTDVNADIAKRSIRCFGIIIVRLPAISRSVTTQLKNFLQMNIGYVNNETMIILKDILRKYQEFIDEFIPFFTKESLDTITDVNSKAAFVWALGQFGEKIPDSPYILEKIVDEEQDSGSLEIHSTLVVACTRLFFKRAPEMHSILSKLYQYVLKQSFDADLRQQVVLYYKLLQQDVRLAEKVINQEVSNNEMEMEVFYEDREIEKRERLFMEFNTLSVVYGRPSENFLKDQVLKQSIAAEKKYYPKERGFKTSDNQEKLLQQQEEQPQANGGGGEIDLLDMGAQDQSQSQATTNADSNNLLDMGLGIDLMGPNTDAQNTQMMGGGQTDLLGGPMQDQNMMGNNNNQIMDQNMGMPGAGFGSGPQTQYSLDGMMGAGTAPSANNFLDSMSGIGMMGSPAGQELIVLSPASELDSERFQQLWMQLPISCGGQVIMKSLRLDLQFTIQLIEGKFTENSLSTMASGQIGNELKFFFHCQMADKSGFFMIEAMFNIQTKVLHMTIKTTRPDLEQPFLQFIENKVINGFII